MNRIFPSLLLIFTSPLLLGSSDIWQTLFKEKLREALQGDRNAQYDVGSLYQNGRGVAPDLEKAVEWYKKSASQDNSKAVNRLKLLAANEVRFRKTLAQANNGNAESQYKLGNMYTRGIGVTIDHAKAFDVFAASAGQGFARAEYMHGLNYYEGTGTSSSMSEAYKWFKVAAEKDHPAAQYYLGKMFAAGEGVKRNYTTSLEWLNKAVSGGFDQARAEIVDVAQQINAAKIKKIKQAEARKQQQATDKARLETVRTMQAVLAKKKAKRVAAAKAPRKAAIARKKAEGKQAVAGKTEEVKETIEKSDSDKNKNLLADNSPDKTTISHAETIDTVTPALENPGEKEVPRAGSGIYQFAEPDKKVYYEFEY